MKKEAPNDGNEFLMFRIGDATVYSRVFKQLLNEAKAISPYGKDMAKMLVQDAEVDFDPDCPTKKKNSQRNIGIAINNRRRMNKKHVQRIRTTAWYDV
jgi:hypothetical protein